MVSTSGPEEPHTETPPAASAQDSVIRAPDPAATPRQPPSLVTTPPARMARTAAARRAATIRPGRAGGRSDSSVCSQVSQPARAASAAPATRASGSCRGSQVPRPLNASVKCSR